MYTRPFMVWPHSISRPLSSVFFPHSLHHNTSLPKPYMLFMDTCLPPLLSFCWKAIPNPSAYSSLILPGSVHLSTSQEVFPHPRVRVCIGGHIVRHSLLSQFCHGLIASKAYFPTLQLLSWLCASLWLIPQKQRWQYQFQVPLNKLVTSLWEEHPKGSTGNSRSRTSPRADLRVQLWPADPHRSHRHTADICGCLLGSIL